MVDKAFVLTLITMVVDRTTKEVLHEENAAVVFSDYREYFDGSGFLEHGDHDAVVYYVKKKMLAALYAPDAMSQHSRIKPLREKLQGRTFYLDALVIRTDEYFSLDHIKNLPRHRWMPEYVGPLLCGLANPWE